MSVVDDLQNREEYPGPCAECEYWKACFRNAWLCEDWEEWFETWTREEDARDEKEQQRRPL